MCSEHVPFRYLFSAKPPRNRAPAATFLGAGGCWKTPGRGYPVLRASARRAAWVGGIDHLAAQNATEGRTVAKKRHSGRASPGTFLPRIGLGAKTALSVT